MGQNGRQASFLAPEPASEQVRVGKVVLALDERPLEVLEEALLSALDDAMRDKLLEAIKARETPDESVKLGAVFEMAKSFALSKRVGTICAVLLDTPENRGAIAAHLGCEASSVSPAVVAEVLRGITARQLLALADALVCVVGLDDLAKSWRSVLSRITPGRPKAPTETSGAHSAV